MSRSWFNRLTFSYLPILIIVPAVLMLLFFAGSAELSKRETARANEVFSRQAVQSLDYSFRSIGEMMNREIVSGEFDAFFSSSANPYLAANETSTRLVRLKLTNPLIDSLYVYRVSDGTVLGNLSIGRLENFADRKFVEQASEGALPTGWSEPRELALPGGQPKTVVTLTRGIPLLTGERGLMVVNVSLDSVRDLLREMIGEETSFIHLYTPEGKLMLGTEAELAAAAAIATENAEAVAAVEEKELSSVTSSYTGWEIRSGLSDGSLSAVLMSVWYAWIAGAALIVILGVAWTAQVSRRNYEPVVRLLQRLDALPPGTMEAAAALTEAAQLEEAGASAAAESGGSEGAGGEAAHSAASDTKSERAERRGRKSQHPDEFARIESTLSAMIARAEADRQRQQEDIVYRRREFFRELTDGSRIVGAEEWAAETAALGVSAASVQDPRFGRAAIGLLEIDRPDEFNRAYSERSRELLRYAIVSAAGELAALRGASLWAEWLPGGRLGLLLRFADLAGGAESGEILPPGEDRAEALIGAASERLAGQAANGASGESETPQIGDSSQSGASEAPFTVGASLPAGAAEDAGATVGVGPDAVGAAAAFAAELGSWVAAHLKCTVTVALGDELASPEEIARGFREAAEAMGYKSTLGGARVIVRRDLRRGAAAELYGVLRTIRELAQAYRMGEAVWQQRLDELLGELRAEPLSKDDLSALMNVLAYQLLREMMELPGEARELWRSEASPRLSAALEHYDTLDDLESAVRNLLGEYAVRLRLLRESRSSHVTLQEVRAYIDANYSDPNLSLSSIADRFGLSSSYLSRLFKDAFGENFVDYLAGVRIDAARRLLRETQSPIQEIAIQVGYANYMSFSRAFKKIVSATPGEYRTRSRTE
ncbi:AraC family transcriptional regulator [Saccharibacillus sp. O23]|uniref:AraC family transcriptional regulator n=1 Tax=Saccharibacillus sp. O23 TaxID=2009338 RepID=UPI00117A4E6F|nr:AraC family transcriptional regulator [Saccharibacillus sp. O23]